MNAGKCIKMALVKAGKTQLWLADKLGMTTAGVSFMVGSEDVSTKRLKQIAKLLDTTTVEILVLTGEL